MTPTGTPGHLSTRLRPCRRSWRGYASVGFAASPCRSSCEGTRPRRVRSTERARGRFLGESPTVDLSGGGPGELPDDVHASRDHVARQTVHHMPAKLPIRERLSIARYDE